MYNPITEKDKKQIMYQAVLGNVKSSLFPDMDIKKIMFNEALYCQEKKRWIENFAKNIFFIHEELQMHINKSEVLCLYTNNYRNDHDEYWKKIKKDVGKVDSITFYTNISKRLDLKNWYKKLNWFFIAMRELSGISNKKDRIYMSTQMAARKWTLEQIKKLKLNPKLVMCYFDSSPDENVLMQYFKQQGAVTVTNQHGLCVFKSREYDLMNQSQILNFKSDYFLARSEKQREEFERAGFNGDKIIVVGYIGNNESEIKIKNTRIIGLLLDCPTVPLSKQASISMIKLVEQYLDKMDYKYIVKCHPVDDISKYRNIVSDRCMGIYGKETSVQKVFEMVDICIVHSSASYVDAYEYGLRCLKYCSEIYFPIAVKEDEFRTGDELKTKIEQWNNKPDKEKLEYITNVRRKYAGKWENGNIQKVIEKLLVSK